MKESEKKIENQVSQLSLDDQVVIEEWYQNLPKAVRELVESGYVLGSWSGDNDNRSPI